ncbi:alpha/beta-hydrolase [Penicillium vulpinum]|nr:alpha/beta-hydrolase [Penicillium vulpinum]KAJ5959868.1 alpha/beta-hydrolase [Penicillium vulpinum]
MPRQAGSSLEVILPTNTIPSYEQRVIGKASSIPGVEEFRGIPYGTVPARWQHGLLRDRLPLDIFDATKNGPRCPQPQEPNNSDFYQSYLEFPSDVTESEFDCLNLFITRPSASALVEAGIDPETARLPVYAYIHGGAYSFGAGTDPMWDPARLVQKSVLFGTPMVVATINYRLNMFGFAASSEIIDAQPDGQMKGGNFGLGDQRIALRWIRNNIAAFSGDAGRVTVGGQSAGGSSSHAHVLEAILSEREPLVQRGIIQSGAVGVLGPISMEDTNKRWDALCKQLGAPDSDAASRMEYMATVSPEQILQANRELDWMVSPIVVDNLTISERPNGRWNIHLDGNEEPVEKDQSAHNSAPIAILIGDTDLEGTMHYSQVTEIKSFDEFKVLLEANVSSKDFLDKFYQVYSLQDDMALADLHKQIFQFLTDIQFGYCVQTAREELMGWEPSAQKSASDTTSARPTAVQSYRMSVGNPFPGINHEKAHHCVDLLYIYDCFADAMRAVDETLPAEATANAALVDRVQADWVRFITAPSPSDQHEMATVYGADRTASVVDMALDQTWVERKSRMDFLHNYQLGAQQTIRALIGTQHVF